VTVAGVLLLALLAQAGGAAPLPPVPPAPPPPPQVTAPAPAPPPMLTAPPAGAYPAPPLAPLPQDAAMALERARAAYEYGDMEMVVESARLVAEGRLRPTQAQRAQALRYLGIGLYVTGRPEGAETAFFDLLRLRPGSRLDPTTTRPDCVAFFEDVRRRHADEIQQAARNRPGKSLVLAFLPPFGQFQNGHRGRGLTIGALEVLSLGSAIATDVQLNMWKTPDDTFGTHHDQAKTVKTLNWLSVGVLVATVAVGIVDGVANYGDEVDEPRSARLDGFGLHF
jgi:hypothetical protein